MTFPFWSYIPKPGHEQGGGQVLLPGGIIICILSIPALRRGPKKYNNEDVARAKEAWDRMYFAEQGAWSEEHCSLLKGIKHKKDA
jgi:hypothetical protein